MSSTRNQNAPRNVSQRRNIDIVSGPRGPQDPRMVRGAQQAMASLAAGEGLEYDDEGKLRVAYGDLDLDGIIRDQEPADLRSFVKGLAGVTTLGRVIDSSYTEATTSTTTSESTFASFDVPSYTLTEGRALRLRAWGVMLNNTGAGQTFTVRVKLGGTDHWRATSGSITAGAFNRILVADVLYMAEGDAYNQQMSGRITIGGFSIPSTGIGGFNAPFVDCEIGQRAGTVNMDLEQAIAVTIAMGASSASLSFTHYGSILFAY